MQWHSVVMEVSAEYIPETNSRILLSCGLGLKLAYKDSLVEFMERWGFFFGGGEVV